MAPILIATKTYLPKPLPTWVQRRRLLDRLNDAGTGQAAVLLLAAMPGSGKSTLLADWANQASQPVAWLTLDANDNNPALFWAYLIAAVQRRQPGFANPLQELLLSAEAPPVQNIPALLVNEFASLDTPLSLVLDEYQVIQNNAVHEGLIFFIEHCPADVKVILSTRSDPPMPLGRWRARGLLAEIRAEDLRFRDNEIRDYFNRILGFDLDEYDISQLSARTEGWVTGLQLAGISMRSRADRKAFINRFSASNQYILDYLISEALASLPADTQEFLEKTSLLKTFSVDLCRQVTGNPNCAEILANLDRNNLFIVSLDDERIWYRYHQLFSEILQTRLTSHNPDAIPHIHKTAADWFDRNGLAEEALNHAIQSGDKAFAADLVASNWARITRERGLAAMLAWFEALGDDQIKRHPLLSTACAWTLWITSRTEPIIPYIDAAEKHYPAWLAAGKIPRGQREYAGIPSQLAALRSLVAVRNEKFEEALQYADECLLLEQAMDEPSMPLGHITRATALRELGEIRRAIEDYEMGVAQERSSVQKSTGLAFYLGKLYQAQGRLADADQLYRETMAQMQPRRNIPAFAILEVALSGLLVEFNQIEEAHALLDKAIAAAGQIGYNDLLKNAGYLQARIQAIQGDRPGTVKVLEETLAQIRQTGTPSIICEVRAVLAACQAGAGQLAAAEQWLEQDREAAFTKIGLSQSIRLFALARVLIHLGLFDRAVDLLEQIETAASLEGNTGWQIQALILLASAHYQRKHPASAGQALLKALTLAEMRGYFRIFLDEGEPVYQTLLAIYPSIQDRSLAHYASQLLEGFRREKDAAQEQAHASGGGLAEPLSQREIEVLRLLSQGLTNQEIAAQMVIALATVKTHVNHIFGKLAADSRIEAVNRAREIGIL